MKKNLERGEQLIVQLESWLKRNSEFSSVIVVTHNPELTSRRRRSGRATC